MASTTSSSSPELDLSSTTTTHHNPWTPHTNHANGHPPSPSSLPNNDHSPTTPPPSPQDIAPLTLRSFALGLTLSASLLLTIHLSPHPLWRLPYFLLTLSLFHYLEFQTTALYNPRLATVSAFLLSQNGRAYNIAHTLAFTECALHWYFYPSLQMGSLIWQRVYLSAGFAMMVIGQCVRTTAMAQAGANFSHVVSVKKKEGHVLVTGGMYRWLRHPSYFGFFWWGLGSQVVLGNVVCLVGYAVVLWNFFRTRIEKEESSLISFFGVDYVKYRDRTNVGIPFIT